MEFVDNIERDRSHLPPCVLEANHRLYSFQEGSIPNLKGEGLIVVIAGNGLQYQGWRGSFDDISMRQVGNASFINEISVDDLVQKMEEIKK